MGYQYRLIVWIVIMGNYHGLLIWGTIMGCSLHTPIQSFYYRNNSDMMMDDMMIATMQSWVDNNDNDNMVL